VSNETQQSRPRPSSEPVHSFEGRSDAVSPTIGADRTGSVRTLVDYHVHTAFSPDAQTPLDTCCREGLRRGLSEIGFCDHVSAQDRRSSSFMSRLVDHRQELQRCRSTYPSLTIRFGLEVDYVPSEADCIRDWLEALETELHDKLDFVVGAVHEVRGRSLIFRDSVRTLLAELGDDRLVHEYFDVECSAAASGLFHVIAHPDLVAKFSQDLFSYDESEGEHAALDLLRTLSENRVALEVNTKGMIHPVARIHPSWRLVRAYLRLAHNEHRTPLLTVGSDAHDRNRIAAAIPETLEALRQIGAAEITGFQRGVPRSIYFCPL